MVILDGMLVLGGGVLLLAVLLFLLATLRRMRRELVALRASEALFRRLTEDVSDVIWRADPNLFITYINPTDEKLRGFRADEVIGHHVFEMFTDEGIATVTKLIQQRQEREAGGTISGAVTFEVQHRCKDGRLLWGEVLSKPERDAHGRITGYHGISRETTERKRLQDQIQQLAFYDPLTGLPNRRLLEDRLGQSLASSRRTGVFGALLFLDLDNFKPLNDLHDHEAGDLLLIEAARRLKAGVRETDTVARFGGDEFVVIIRELDRDPAVSREQVATIAEKLRGRLAEPYRLSVEHGGLAGQEIEHRCSASIGIRVFIGNGVDPDEILKQADLAMYEAKDAGRNTVRFFSPPAETV
ncbi:diguanylate cyclase [Azonexus fungiphilus]|nr:sensor domain-containing diguanylate cyclase [Azonexus fungiphilus]NHC06371.1 diguanylate cyclase [Azonexus fungiphilus]